MEKYILIACEESQEVCKAFRELGFIAYSCDLQRTNGNPQWHLLGDAIKAMEQRTGITQAGETIAVPRWDLIIAHPPCTYLCRSGERWFDVGKYGDKALQRLEDRKKAFDFFMRFANSDCPRIAIENPIGYVSTHYRKPDQIIQPWQFGHEASKATCLWLKNLPKLKPTDIVSKGEFVQFPNGGRMSKWYAEAFYLKPRERAKVRSKTFHGIALAMARQWGEIL